MTTELPDTHPSQDATGPLALKSNLVLGPNARDAALDPTRAWTLAQRCELATKCLPVSGYRVQVESLHADMLAEIERLRAVLAKSCDEERSQMWEAGPGGGCVRAIEAELERDKLLAALREVLEFQSDPKAPTIHDFWRWRRVADGLGA